MSGDNNIGYYQTGSGHISNSGPTAVGFRASATGGSTGTPTEPTPEQALAALRRLLAEHGGSLADADRARARGELAEVSDELAATAPDPGRLSGAVARLTAALSSVTVLASAAETLKEAVGRLLG